MEPESWAKTKAAFSSFASDNLRHALGYGALGGACFFVADTLGAFWAIGDFFDPQARSFLLIAIAGALSMLVGMLAGPLVWPLWAFAHKKTKVPATFVLLLGLGLVFALGAYSRRGRIAKDLAPPVSTTTAAKSRPPILWIVIDTLRRDALYGPTSEFPLQFPDAPRIGAHAKTAKIFRHAQAAAGWTVPSTAALFTGLSSISLDASAGKIPDFAPTVAQTLYSQGYATHALVDNALVEPRAGFARGFMRFEQRSGYRFAFSLPAFRLLPRYAMESLRTWSRASYSGAESMAKRTIARIDTLDEQAPAFVYAHFMDPHAPYYLHPPSADAQSADDIHFTRYRDELRGERRFEPTPQQVERLKQRYRADIRYTDTYVGQILDRWFERFGDKGMVLLTSDHGEEFMDHGHLSHGDSVHDELVGIPLLLWLPAQAAPEALRHGVSDAPVQHIDLVPTTYALLDLKPKDLPPGPALMGRSLLHLFSDAPLQPLPLLSSHARHGKRTYRYVEDPWVYIRNDFFDGQKRQEMLFDRRLDPQERRDLSASKSHGARFRDIQKRAQKAIGEHWQRFRTWSKEGGVPGSQQKDAPDDTEETLRALGYIH